MIRYCYSLILFLFLTGISVNAQADSSQQFLFNQIYSAAENAYGIDQELINGFLVEDKNQDAIGHPYFLDHYSNTGSVTYREKHYSNLSLRYDIHDQLVLLIYPYNGLEYKLHLHGEYITEFTIGNKKFIKAAFDAHEKATFYQVIGEDLSIKILRLWEKGLTNIYTNNSDTKMFTARNDSFILINNQLLGFKGNRSFMRKFPAESKTPIRKYFRMNTTRVKHATDHEMEQLIEFINILAG